MPFPVDAQHIIRAEAKLGVRLPLSYIVQMQKANGGSVEAGSDSWQLHAIFDDSDRKRLKRTCNDIIRETKQAQEWPDFPPNAVAIGSNGTGDRLVFLRPEGAERMGEEVYWWDHETGELHKVADDFLDLPKA